MWRFPPTGQGYGEIPEEVFRRILRSSSTFDDLVIIPFLGSGTAALLTELFGRHWIAIDADPQAITAFEQLQEQSNIEVLREVAKLECRQSSG